MLNRGLISILAIHVRKPGMLLITKGLYLLFVMMTITQLFFLISAAVTDLTVPFPIFVLKCPLVAARRS